MTHNNPTTSYPFINLCSACPSAQHLFLALFVRAHILQDRYPTHLANPFGICAVQAKESFTIQQLFAGGTLVSFASSVRGISPFLAEELVFVKLATSALLCV